MNLHSPGGGGGAGGGAGNASDGSAGTPAKYHSDGEYGGNMSPSDGDGHGGYASEHDFSDADLQHSGDDDDKATTTTQGGEEEAKAKAEAAAADAAQKARDDAVALRRAVEALERPDSIMDLDIAQRVRAFIGCSGGGQSPERVVQLLSQAYVGAAQMCNIASTWLELLPAKQQQTASQQDVNKMSNSTNALILSHLQHMVESQYNPALARNVFAQCTQSPPWLEHLVTSPSWQQVLQLLAQRFPQCTLLTFCLRKIKAQSASALTSAVLSSSSSSKQHDAAAATALHPSFAAFDALLQKLLQKLLLGSGSDDTQQQQQLVSDLEKVCTQSQHTYMWTQHILAALIRKLQQQHTGSSNNNNRHALVLQRVSALLSDAAQQRDNSSAALVGALTSQVTASPHAGAQTVARIVNAIAMQYRRLSSDTELPPSFLGADSLHLAGPRHGLCMQLSPSDIAQLYARYSAAAASPPCVHLLRVPGFLDALVSSLFHPDRAALVKPAVQTQAVFLVAYACVVKDTRSADEKKQPEQKQKKQQDVLFALSSSSSSSSSDSSSEQQKKQQTQQAKLDTSALAHAIKTITTVARMSRDHWCLRNARQAWFPAVEGSLSQQTPMPIVGIAALTFVAAHFASPMYFQGPYHSFCTERFLALLARIVQVHPMLRFRVFALVEKVLFFETGLDRMKAIQLQRLVLRVLVHLCHHGLSAPVFRLLTAHANKLDRSLLRYVIALLLDTTHAPYSRGFVSLVTALLALPEARAALDLATKACAALQLSDVNLVQQQRVVVVGAKRSAAAAAAASADDDTEPARKRIKLTLSSSSKKKEEKKTETILTNRAEPQRVAAFSALMNSDNAAQSTALSLDTPAVARVLATFAVYGTAHRRTLQLPVEQLRVLTRFLPRCVLSSADGRALLAETKRSVTITFRRKKAAAQ
jgi:hypothetical protein